MPTPFEASQALMTPDLSGYGINPQDIIRALHGIAPNLTGLASGEPPPPLQNLPATPGKVPGTEDPRITGAIQEGAMLGSTALAPFGMGAAGPVAEMGAAAMPRIAPRLAAGAESALGSPSLPVGMAASLGAASEAGAAAPKLNYEQRQQLEAERQKQQLGTDAATARTKAAGEAEVAKTKAMGDVQLQQQRQQQEMATTHEREQAERPFRERYPNLSNAMAMSGLALSALVPYGTRMAQMGTYNKFMTDFHGLATRAEEALVTGNRDRAQLLANALTAAGKQAKTLADPTKASPAATVAGSLTPLEMQRAPELMDVVSGSPKAKEQAEGKLLDPSNILGLGTGVAGGLLGAKAPLPPYLGRQMPPPAGYEGMAKALKTMKKPKSQ